MRCDNDILLRRLDMALNNQPHWTLGLSVEDNALIQEVAAVFSHRQKATASKAQQEQPSRRCGYTAFMDRLILALQDKRDEEKGLPCQYAWKMGLDVTDIQIINATVDLFEATRKATIPTQSTYPPPQGNQTPAFTETLEGSSKNRLLPNTTCPDPTLNRADPVIPAFPIERIYNQARAAIRQAVLRQTEYKVADTAQIFENLRKTGNLEQGTKDIEQLLRDLIDQAQFPLKERIRQLEQLNWTLIQSVQTQTEKNDSLVKGLNQLVVENHKAQRPSQAFLNKGEYVIANGASMTLLKNSDPRNT